MDKKELKTNDYLAIKRSELANDRTLLAFMRTGLMFFVSGITIIKVFNSNTVLLFIGYSLIPVSVTIIITGIFYYMKIKKEFKSKY